MPTPSLRRVEGAQRNAYNCICVQAVAGEPEGAFSCLGGLIKKNSAYNTGTATSVRIEANARPPMIVTAIDAKKASDMSGVIPKIVVPAASTTGLKRLTEPSITA